MQLAAAFFRTSKNNKTLGHSSGSNFLQFIIMKKLVAHLAEFLNDKKTGFDF